MKGLQRQISAQANAGTVVQVLDQLIASDEFVWEPGLYYSMVQALNPGLYWRLGDAAGSTNVLDSSGNVLTGTPGATVTLGQPGALANDLTTSALFGNASTSSVTSSTYQPYVVGSKNTFMGWANRTSTADEDILLSGSLNFAAGSPLMFLGSGNENVSFRALGNGTGASWNSVWPGTGQWVHWAVTYDDSILQAQLYINGAAQAVRTIASGNGYNGAANDFFTVGAQGTTSGTNAFNGYMQEVASWPVILTAAEIQAVYIAGILGDESSLSTATSTFLWGGPGEWNAATWN